MDMNQTCQVTVYEESANPMRIQKCRINGEEYEVPVNTWKQMAHDRVETVDVPKKVGVMLQNAGHKAYVSTIGIPT